MYTDRNKYLNNDDYPFSETTGRIIEAAQAVHYSLGPGFEEVVYQRALALELQVCNLDFEREVIIEVYYKGQKIGKKRVDFVVENILVELKARAVVEPVHFVQTWSYLKASGFPVALLLNFGAERLFIKRLANTRKP